MADYWKNRMLDAQQKWTDKDIDAINKILRHYFMVASSSVIKEFEATYKKVLEQAEEGKPITPADLYRLDKYYQMNTQYEAVLKQLGDRTINVLQNKFAQEYKHIYSALAIDKDDKAVKAAISDKAFSTIANESAKQVASQVWCTDGKSWSQRIWGNIEDLKQTLNDGLVECVVTGKKPTQLKQEGELVVIKLRLPDKKQHLSRKDGFRLIYLVSKTDEIIVFLYIYPKNGPLQQLSITDIELKLLMKEFINEVQNDSLEDYLI